MADFSLKNGKTLFRLLSDIRCWLVRKRASSDLNSLCSIHDLPVIRHFLLYPLVRRLINLAVSSLGMGCFYLLLDMLMNRRVALSASIIK